LTHRAGFSFLLCDSVDLCHTCERQAEAISMAKVLKPSGRYVSREAIEKRRKILAAVLGIAAIGFGFGGYLIGQLLRHSPVWALGAAFLALVLLFRLLFTLARRKIEGLEQEVDLSGDAEAFDQVRSTLEDLPDEFQVIHDLSTPFGKVDHVVIGPTGVFVLSTKAWKGEVSSDGNGELLWNQYPLDEPVLRLFAETVSRLKERVQPVGKGAAPEFQPIFVFTAAALKLDDKTTQFVRCIPEARLRGQLLSNHSGATLKDEEIEMIAQGLLAIAA
jgi:nuclease-like protein